MTDVLSAWPRAKGAEKALHLFRNCYQYSPAGSYSAPGRVNVIGEHTDYNGGLALPIALPHRTYVAAALREDRLVRLASAQTPDERTEISLDQVGPRGSDKQVDGWAAYVVGVLWAIEENTGHRLSGMDIAVDSCVPFGSGLSSSAALECAVAAAVDHLNDLDYLSDDAGRATLAAACVRAENEVAGAPTGGLDQAASLRCTAGHALAIDCRTDEVEHIPFDLLEAGLELLVVDTRAPHQLSDGQYADRRETCERACKQLGVESLREFYDQVAQGQVNPREALEGFDPITRKRVRHVVTEIARTVDAIELLERAPGKKLTRENLEVFGALMNASHDSLRDDYEVTCPELDEAVRVARQQHAIGARMTGGGFGGSIIVLTQPKRGMQIANHIAASFAQHRFNAPMFLHAVPADPAGVDSLE